MSEISYGSPMPGDIEAWARRLVTAHSDGAHYHGDDGLLIESHEMGFQPVVTRENTNTAMEGCFYRVALSIQLATYPNAEFDSPFWDQPDRTWETVMLQHGDNACPGITMPEPLTVPTLVRVVAWRAWVPELSEEDVVGVTYTLFNLRPALASA